MVKLSKSEITKMRIKRIEKEIRDTPFHKGTEHHIGRLRAKLSKLKEELLSSGTKKGGGKGGYAVKKQGDATVTLVGAPSVGKSTLLNLLTNARSKIAPYAFTTVSVVPGMMNYKDAKIQVLDVPGLIEGAEVGKGRGKEVLSVVRGSDLLLIMCDVNNVSSIKTIEESLEKSGIRLNKVRPKITIEKKVKGGIQVITNIKQDFGKDTVKEVAKEFRIANGEITIKEKLSVDRLIDAFSPNRVYIPAIHVINKIDEDKFHQGLSLKQRQSLKDAIQLSAERGINIDNLKKEIWNKLQFVRVYLVRSDEKPSKNHPLIMKQNSTLKDVSVKIGEEFSEDKKRAVIWGPGSKFPGQEVSLVKEIVDGMQIRFI
jgi:small GTP-binding protein